MSAVQLSRNLDVQYKTAVVLMHTLREVMARETTEACLAGDVEIDGAYFGGHARPANLRKDRVDRRLFKNRSGKRRVVVVPRQRGGRTLTRAFLREAEGIDFAKERVEPGSTLSADELPHWDLFADRFDVRRVNHSDAYSESGVHTNLAESYLSRPRADDPRAASRGQRQVSRRLCRARRLARRSLQCEQWSDGGSPDPWGARRSGQPDLGELLATTRSVTASPTAQTHMPLRFSTIRTSLRRAACRNA